jgi:hypothetical protein
MKNDFTESLGASFAILFIVFSLICVALTVHGLYLAFSASIILGIVAFFVEPAPLIFSLVYLVWGKNLPEMIVKWLAS